MLNIKNPRAHELAREIATAEGVSLTAAVVDALERRAAEIRQKKADGLEDYVRRVKAAAAAFKANWDPNGPSLAEIERDMYDEDGLPR